MARGPNDTYVQQLRSYFEKIIDGLELTDLQKDFLRGRWLDQLLWFEKKSGYNQRRYFILRLATIVGGVIVPAVVSLNVREGRVTAGLAWATFALSLVVALSAALEGFFSYGERWRSFRRTSEALKTHGWQFFELAGPYAQWTTHTEAFPAFTAHVETMIQQDVEAFIAQAAQVQAAQQAARTGGATLPSDHP